MISLPSFLPFSTSVKRALSDRGSFLVRWETTLSVSPPPSVRRLLLSRTDERGRGRWRRRRAEAPTGRRECRSLCRRSETLLEYFTEPILIHFVRLRKLSFAAYTGPGNNTCMWFGEVGSCCCLPLLPQLACNILATTYKYYFRAQ